MSVVLIFAGGEASSPRVIEEIPDPDYVIAADSGYHNARRLGFAVDVVVGDLDSLAPDSIPDGIEVVRHPEDKDATDLELAFELAIRHNPRRLVLVGAEGGRFDHELAAAQLICAERWAGVPEIDWVRDNATCSVIRGIRRLQGDARARVTLLAMGGDATGVVTDGLKWPLEGETLPFGSSRGVSNVIMRPEFSISVAGGVVLAILAHGLD